jgi:hypothetical protein
MRFLVLLPLNFWEFLGDAGGAAFDDQFLAAAI